MANVIKIAFVACLLTTACGETRRVQSNYEFETRSNLGSVYSLYQNEPPTEEQVTTMATMAWHSQNWSFCVRNAKSQQVECFHANLMGGRASCLATLHNVNALLRRKLTAEQRAICYR